MRYVMYGAGATGGVIGARLHQHGREAVLICRGAHLDAIRERGITLRTPLETATLPVPVVASPRELTFRDDDVVMLTMKTQDIVAALNELRDVAGDRVPVVCAQNAVINEFHALRRFRNVYGLIVRFPGFHLEPGVVLNYDANGAGEIEIGRYPEGVDGVATTVAADLTAAGFDGQVEPRIIRWKYEKLIVNLGSAFAGVFGPGADTAAIRAQLDAEALACYRAAGIDAATRDEAVAIGREPGFEWGTIEGAPPFASSLWQGIQRGLRSAETDYINGEIAMLGALNGVPTPYNRAFNLLANRCAHEGTPPGAITVEEFERMVEAELAV